MKSLYRIPMILIIAVSTLTGAIGGIVTYQSYITSQVIENSLNRHAEQRLIERTTRDIILQELDSLHLWLGINSFAVFALTGFVIFLLFKITSNKERDLIETNQTSQSEG